MWAKGQRPSNESHAFGSATTVKANKNRISENWSISCKLATGPSPTGPEGIFMKFLDSYLVPK